MTSIQIDRTDGLSSSVAIKGPCRVATTANVTLSGEQTIDGVAVVTDDRVLVKDQTTASENGIYVVDTGSWRRAKDFSRTNDVKSGTQVFVVSGTAHASTQFALTTLGEILVGTTDLTFEQSSIGYSDLAEISTVVETRTALKALDTTTETVAFLKEFGREGVFIWRAGDYSTLIAADTLEGLYVKATAIASSAGSWVRQREDFGVNVKWFGAVCDNSTDDAAAINSAIANLPVIGGDVRIPGPCMIASPIVCGNGTSSVLSTRYGIHLVGTSLPNFTKDGSHPAANAAALRYTGSSGQAIITFYGPMIGWGVENLVIDARGVTNTKGLVVYSGSMGVTNNLVFHDCKIAYELACHSAVTGYTPDISSNCDVIRGGNIVIHMPDQTYAIGMLFDGSTDGTASTCFVDLTGVRIYPSAANINYGIVFKVADTVSIKNLLIYGRNPVVAGTCGVLYEYTGHPYFPCGCMLDVVDVGYNIPVSQQFVNNGSSGGAAGQNRITNLSEVNACRYPSQLPNVTTDQETIVQRSYLASDYTGTDVSTAQSVFAASQDSVVLKANRNYRFRGIYNIIRAAGATSHTTGILFGGNATLNNIAGVARVSNPTGNILGAVSEITFSAVTETVITAANTSTTENVRVELQGIVRVTTAGTLIPQFKYSAAPGGAPTVKRGSFFEVWPIGEGGQAWTGDWL